jgi:hypothetical protein
MIFAEWVAAEEHGIGRVPVRLRAGRQDAGIDLRCGGA